MRDALLKASLIIFVPQEKTYKKKRVSFVLQPLFCNFVGENKKCG